MSKTIESLKKEVAVKDDKVSALFEEVSAKRHDIDRKLDEKQKEIDNLRVILHDKHKEIDNLKAVQCSNEDKLTEKQKEMDNFVDVYHANIAKIMKEREQQHRLLSEILKERKTASSLANVHNDLDNFSETRLSKDSSDDKSSKIPKDEPKPGFGLCLVCNKAWPATTKSGKNNETFNCKNQSCCYSYKTKTSKLTNK